MKRVAVLGMRLVVALIGLMLTQSAWADGDPAVGERQFAPCSSCHTVDVSEANTIGPNLFGVYGKPAASNRPDYTYSDALKKSGLIWNDETLDSWLRKPMAMVAETKMTFLGVSSAEMRANIIAFLKTKK
jgi:cytochrome c